MLKRIGQEYEDHRPRLRLRVYIGAQPLGTTHSHQIPVVPDIPGRGTSVQAAREDDRDCFALLLSIYGDFGRE